VLTRVLLPIIVAALAAGCGSDPGDEAPTGWHVRDGQIRDVDGRSVILRGANVSGRHKSPPYFDYHTAEDYVRLRDELSLNSVRFLISWAAIEPERDVYDMTYLDAVADRIATIEAQGLFVILDMHQDLYGEGFNGNGAPQWTCDQQYYDAYEPIEPWFANYANENIVACYDGFWGSADLQSHYVEAWRLLAQRLASSSAVIGVDPMNEPYWGSAGPSDFEEHTLSALYEQVITAVRVPAPNWLAFIEPSSSRNLGIATRLPRFSFDNIVYAPHSYDQNAEAGDGFDAARRDALMGNVVLLRQEADVLGAALWIGEYGGSEGDGGIFDYMDAQYDAIGLAGGSSAYWTYSKGGGYELLDADGNEKPELARAVVRPYPERVAGQLHSYSYQDASQTLEVVVTADTTISAPTVIVVPTRLYPAGVNVDCGGCTVEEIEDGRVRLSSLPDVAELKIRVSPK